jgi:hypothetical protein
VAVPPAAATIQFQTVIAQLAQRIQAANIVCPVFGYLAPSSAIFWGGKYFETSSALAEAAKVTTNTPARADDMNVMAFTLFPPDGTPPSSHDGTARF